MILPRDSTQRFLALVESTVLVLLCCLQSVATAGPLFERVAVDVAGPVDPWGKSIGDLNGDGRQDLIAGGSASGGLVWYENPSWAKHTISSDGGFATDHEVADIDGDTRQDVVSLERNRLVWFRAPAWQRTVIDERRLHDVEVADLDGDGDNDIVARGQTEFSGNGDSVHLYRQDSPTAWTRISLGCPPGEGLRVADLDDDGKPDIVVNNQWFKNPGGVTEPASSWSAHSYSSTWAWDSVAVDVADINGDNRVDIVLSPAELAGQSYRLAWFEAPVSRVSPWQEHLVEAGVEAVHHFVAAADFDNDGNIDIASAEMHQGGDPDEIKLYMNRGQGRQWTKEVVATTGSHNMRVLDVDNDCDLDLFGANWSGSGQNLELWVNQSARPASCHLFVNGFETRAGR